MRWSCGEKWVIRCMTCGERSLSLRFTRTWRRGVRSEAPISGETPGPFVSITLHAVLIAGIPLRKPPADQHKSHLTPSYLQNMSLAWCRNSISLFFPFHQNPSFEVNMSNFRRRKSPNFYCINVSVLVFHRNYLFPSLL